MEVSRTIISNILLITGLLGGSLVNAQTATPTPSTTGMVIDSVGGASAYTVGTEASGTVAATLPTIYGGLTDTLCATTDGTSTCNSCTNASGLAVCNMNSIYTTLLLQITLRSGTASSFQGSPKVIWRVAGGTSVFPIVNTPSLVAGQAFTAQIRWSDLCSAAGAGTNCQTLIGTKTLNIGIDTNNDDDFEEKVDFNLIINYVDSSQATLSASCPVGATTLPASTEGICDYTVARGDEKVYITDYAASGNDLYTANSSVKFNRLVLFYLENVADATTISSATPTYIVLNLTNNAPSEPSISDNRLTGLVNGTPYCFALGNMDQTGNISRFPLPADLAVAAKVCATPAEVVGLLDDKSCFIATATFGSQMAPEVQTFRQFRNEIMLTNSVGKHLVKAYYKFGPEAAEWVSHSEFLRTLSLWVLWPLLMFVKLSLALGLLPAALISLAAMILLKRSFSHLWQVRSLKGDA